jgi:acyl-CoA hydrolase
MSHHSIRYNRLADQALIEIAEQRGKEVERLRLELVNHARAAQEVMETLRAENERLRAIAFPDCKHERHDVIQQGQTFCRWKCKACGYYGESSWD